MYRDHNCGELTIKNVNETVQLAGWVQRIRNLGSIAFVDLRDQYGITQIVVSSNNNKTSTVSINVIADSSGGAGGGKVMSEGQEHS